MPLTERMKAAYHEAGHAIRAYYEDRRSVNQVYIEQVGPRWDGNTKVVKRYIPNFEWSSISFAGIAAEAKAEALDAGGFVELVPTPDLFAEMWDVVNVQFNALAVPPAPLAPAWPINIETAPDITTSAALSREDISQVPPDQRQQALLEATLAEVLRFFNDDLTWAVVTALASKLDQIYPRKLGAFGLQYLVEKAVNGYEEA